MKRWLSPYERRQRWARVERWAIALALLYVLLWLIDPHVYRAFPDADAPAIEGAAPRVYRPGDWGEFFHVVGTLPLWLAAALCVFLAGRPHDPAPGRSPREQAIWLLLIPTLAGAAAEAMKVFLGRDRPGPHGGEHVYRPFFRADFFDAGNLGLPSSHAAVAFGGACALVALFPRTWPVAFLGAIGCAWGRVYAGDHFLTDVYVGALVGYGVSRLIRRWAPAR